MAGLGDLIVVVEDLATYQAAQDQGKTAPSVMYLILKERQVYFNSELWSKAPEEGGGGGGVSQEDFDALYDGVIENEEVTASALFDLNSRVDWLKNNVSGQAVSKDEFNEALEDLRRIIAENEQVNAAAWTDLDARLKSIGI